MQKMYPGLVEEMKLKEGSIKDSVLKHRSVVATRRNTNKTISAVHTMCVELVDAMDIGECLTYTQRRQLETGDGDFAKLAHHIQQTVRRRRSVVQVVENEKLDEMRNGLVQMEEALAAAQLQLQNLHDTLVRERDAWNKERIAMVLRPVVPTAHMRGGVHAVTSEAPATSDASAAAVSTMTSSTVSPSDAGAPPLAANATAEASQLDNSVLDPPYTDSALHDISNVRRSHKYQTALEKGTTASMMIVACMKRLATELSPAERVALLHELVGDVVMSLHTALVPLFHSQLFRRLHVLSDAPRSEDPLLMFERARIAHEQQQLQRRKHKEGSPAASLPPPKLLPNIEQLLHYDASLIRSVFDLLKADSAQVVAKMKATFERVKMGVMLRKTKVMLQKRTDAVEQGKREAYGYQSTREAAFLERREAVLAKELVRLDQLRVSIESKRHRAAAGRFFERMERVPMHPVLLFLSETDVDEAPIGGLSATDTDASDAYMHEFRNRIVGWYEHAHDATARRQKLQQAIVAQQMQRKSAADESNGTLHGPAVSSTIAPHAQGSSTAPALQQKSDDAWKSRSTPSDYVNQLLPVKSVDMQVDRELGRRRLTGPTTTRIKMPSHHAFNASMRTAPNTMKALQLVHAQQRIIDALSLSPPPASPAPATAGDADVLAGTINGSFMGGGGQGDDSSSVTPMSSRAIGGRRDLPPLASTPSPTLGGTRYTQATLAELIVTDSMAESPVLPSRSSMSRHSLSTPPPSPWGHHAGIDALPNTLGGIGSITQTTSSSGPRAPAAAKRP